MNSESLENTEKTPKKQRKLLPPWPKGVSGNPNGRPKLTKEEKLIKKTVKQVIEDHIPLEDLAKVTKEGLKANTKKPHLVGRDDKGRPIYDYVPEADFHARHKYLETTFKVLGAFPKEGPGVAVQINFNEEKEKYK